MKRISFAALVLSLLTTPMAASAATFTITLDDGSGGSGTFEAPEAGGLVTSASVTRSGITYNVINHDFPFTDGPWVYEPDEQFLMSGSLCDLPYPGPSANCLAFRVVANVLPSFQIANCNEHFCLYQNPTPFQIAEAVIPPLTYVAYVANQETSTVSVIDVSNNAVAAAVRINVAPRPFGIAVAPDAAHVYVSNRESNSVTVVDTATNAITATVAVGSLPYQIAFLPDGSFAYVGNVNSNNVSVINTSTNTVAATIAVGDRPFAVAITPDGTHAYVPNLGSNNVSVIATSINTVTATIAVGVRPEAVAIAPNGTRVYVANQGSNNVSVIDTATNTVVATVPVGRLPENIAIAPDGTYVYVANHFYPGTVSIIDTSTNAVVATVLVGGEPEGIAVTPDNAAVYVVNPFTHDVSVIETETNTVTRTIPLGVFVRPRAVAITPVPIDIDIDNDDLGISADNCPTVANFEQFDTNNDGIGDACDELTPPGVGVLISPVVALPNDEGTTTVELTFEAVATGGTSTVTTSSSPSGTPESPTGFQIGEPPVYYDVSTTADFNGSVTLCFSWLEGQFTDESNIMLFHYEDATWTNVTTSLNTTANEICGSVTSLSPFALLESSFAGFFAPVDNPPVRNVVKAGAAVPVKFSLGGNYGLSIFKSGSPGSQSVSCDDGAGLDVIEETVTAGDSRLTYDNGSDLYTYVWKTNKTWARTCRRLVFELTSGSRHLAEFSFTK